MSDDVSEFIAMATTAAASIEAADAPTPVEPAAVVDPEAKPELEVKPEVKEPPKEAPAKDWKKAAAIERQHRESKQSNRAHSERLAAENKQLAAEIAKHKTLRERAASDPLSVMEELGLSYDAATKAYIKTLEQDPAKPDPTTANLIQKLQQLETKIAQQEQTMEQRQTAEIIRGFEAEVSGLLSAKADDFELVRTAEGGGLALVKEIVGAHWRETAPKDANGRIIGNGETMPTEEACKLAEKFFQKEQIDRFAKTKKFAAAIAANTAPAKVEKPTSTTLTQDMRQGGAPPQPLSDENAELMRMYKQLESQLGG